MSQSELFKPDLDMTGMINKLFPTEQSLSMLDSVVSKIDSEVAELDAELADLVEMHGQVTEDGMTALAKVTCLNLTNNFLNCVLGKLSDERLGS